jgi:alkylation response protein AidB-like acyl-CoA dehydrogenase
MGKLLGSNVSRYVRSVALEIVGPISVAWDVSSLEGPDIQRDVLHSFQDGIAGGTDEIQRNILGERVLGLPREPLSDRWVAFRDLLVAPRKH